MDFRQKFGGYGVKKTDDLSLTLSAMGDYVALVAKGSGCYFFLGTNEEFPEASVIRNEMEKIVASTLQTSPHLEGYKILLAAVSKNEAAITRWREERRSLARRMKNKGKKIITKK